MAVVRFWFSPSCRGFFVGLVRNGFYVFLENDSVLEEPLWRLRPGWSNTSFARSLDGRR